MITYFWMGQHKLVGLSVS